MMLAGVGITVMDKISDGRCRILQVGQAKRVYVTCSHLTLSSGKPILIDMPAMPLSHFGGKGAKARTPRG